MQSNMKYHFVQEFFVDGEKRKEFKFTKELDIEEPIHYLRRIFSEYFYSDICNKPIIDTINYYCYEKNIKLKDGKTVDELDTELEEFNLLYTPHSEVYVYDDGNYVNLREKSPGTQANYLMEYLIYKDTNRPLLIDQPEDNIDNQTIYGQLTSWFRKLKNKRQVIVITHDANIVINSDSENIIIANNLADNKFDYKYGSLEFENNLETAANILDGGKEAIKRRMNKYGEQENKH